MHGWRHSFASASFSALLIACRDQAPTTTSSAPEASPVAEPPTDAAPEVLAPEPASAGPLPRPADPYLTGAPTSAKAIGHTSYVLKVRLDNGRAAAFKARSTLPLGDRRYKGEVAAYRLARALGLENVPVALPRAFVAAQLRRAFATPEGAQDFDRKGLVDRDGTIRGALIPWIERYEELPVEEGPGRARWEKWLTDASPDIAEADRAMARAMSTMIVFDYVTGNWDRWSGGNVARDGATGTLLFVDNDGAFYESPPTDALRRQLALLRRVRRFSRTFVAALRALDVATLRDALGQDLQGDLLPVPVVEATDARRQTALETIDQQIARAGEAATLAFD
jgi:hypothetical protein